MSLPIPSGTSWWNPRPSSILTILFHLFSTWYHRVCYKQLLRISIPTVYCRLSKKVFQCNPKISSTSNSKLQLFHTDSLDLGPIYLSPLLTLHPREVSLHMWPGCCTNTYSYVWESPSVSYSWQSTTHITSPAPVFRRMNKAKYFIWLSMRRWLHMLSDAHSSCYLSVCLTCWLMCESTKKYRF